MKNWFLKLSPTMQLVVVIILVIIIYFLFKTGKGFLQSATTKVESIGEIAQLTAQGQQRSYTDSQYRTFANKLYYAMAGMGTDEDAIYDVFRKMNNDVDVIHLINQFGSKDTYDLSEWLLDDLSSEEIDKVNKILTDKGITKTF